MKIGEKPVVKLEASDEVKVENVNVKVENIKVETVVSETAAGSNKNIKKETAVSESAVNNKKKVIDTEKPSTSTENGANKRKSGEKEIKKEENVDSNGGTDESVKSPKQAKWVPKNWEKTLENLRVMRLDRSAPVDSMGCNKCTDENADEKVC